MKQEPDKTSTASDSPFSIIFDTPEECLKALCLKVMGASPVFKSENPAPAPAPSEMPRTEYQNRGGEIWEKDSTGVWRELFTADAIRRLEHIEGCLADEKRRHFVNVEEERRLKSEKRQRISALERELAEAVRERDDLRGVMEMNKPGMDRAQAMLDGGRWAGFTLIEGVTTELAEARELIAVKDQSLHTASAAIHMSNEAMAQATDALTKVREQRDALVKKLFEIGKMRECSSEVWKAIVAAVNTPTTILGFPVVADPTMPPDAAAVRDDKTGEVLAVEEPSTPAPHD